MTGTYILLILSYLAPLVAPHVINPTIFSPFGGPSTLLILPYLAPLVAPACASLGGDEEDGREEVPGALPH